MAWHKALAGVGIESVVTQTVDREIWQKFILLSSFSGMTSMTRRPIGDVRSHADTGRMLKNAVTEVAKVAEAHGIRYDDDIVGRTLALIDTMPAAMKSSMQEDLERGKPLELPWLSGAVVRLGAAKDIDTPTHLAIEGALILHAEGS
jgi:2-dehydropantoate 2-reductase